MERSLTLRVLFAGVERLTAPLRRIGSTSKITARDIATTRREVLQLERGTAKVRGFRDLQTQIGNTHQEMDVARRRVTALQAAIAQADGPTGRLERQMESAQRKVEKLGQVSDRQAGRLQVLGNELGEAGIDVRRLADAEDDLARSLDRANARLEEQRTRQERLDRWNKRADKISSAGDKLQSAGTKSLAAGAAVAVPVAIGAKSSMEFEDAMADVRKVVDATDVQFAKLTSNIKQLSRETPMPPAAIASIVAAGARAGVARQDLTAFARDAVQMGVAFDSTAEEAGSMMATWRTAFKLTQPEVVALADRVNALTNAYGGNVAGVTEMVTRIGPLGNVAGVAAPSLAAIAQLMDSVGVGSEVGATGIKNMMLALSKGEAATKSQRGALQGLGLDAEQVARRMQVDSKSTILDVLTRISKLDVSRQAGALDQLFGSESISAIAPLLTNLPALERNFAMVGDQARYAGSMQAEYAARAATNSSKLDRMRNRVEVMKITLGDKLMPVLMRGADWLGRLADRVTMFAERHPALTGAMGALLTVMGAVLIVFGGLALAIGTILKPIAWLVRMVPRLGGGSAQAGRLASMLRLIGTAGGSAAGGIGRVASVMRLLASPAGLVMRLLAMVAPLAGGIVGALGTAAAAIGGVLGAITAPMWGVIAVIGAAVIGLVLFIRNNIGGIAAFFSSMWSSLAAATAPLRASLSALGTALYNLGAAFLGWIGRLVGPWLSAFASMAGAAMRFVGAAIRPLLSAAAAIGRVIGGAIGAALSWIGKLVGPIAIEKWQSWGNLVGGFIGNVLGKLKGFVDWLTRGANALTNFFNGSARGPASTAQPRPTAAPRPAPIAGKRARGGPVGAGRLYLVGEEGPELFEAPGNGRIIPNDRLPRSATPRRPMMRAAAATAMVAAPLAAAAAPIVKLPPAPAPIVLQGAPAPAEIRPAPIKITFAPRMPDVPAPADQRPAPAQPVASAPIVVQKNAEAPKSRPLAPAPIIVSPVPPAPIMMPRQGPPPVPARVAPPIVRLDAPSVESAPDAPTTRQAGPAINIRNLITMPPPMAPAIAQAAAPIVNIAMRVAPPVVRPIENPGLVERHIQPPAIADARPLVIRPPAPAVVPAATGSGAKGGRPAAAAPTITFSGPITIAIHQQPGESADQLAQRFEQLLEQRARNEAARLDSSFEDRD